MPIYEQTYRHWDGELKDRALRWWVIASRELRNTLRRKRTILVLAIALILFLFRATIVVATLGYLDQFAFILNKLAALISDWPGFFSDFLGQQTLFVVLITIFSGAALISNDLKGNAITFYMARPLTRLDYVAGKLAVILAFVFAITLAPGLFMFAMKAFLSSDRSFLREYYWMAASILAYSLLTGLFFSMFMLMFSATNKNPRDAALRFVGVFFVSDIIAALLKKITGSEAVMALSIGKDQEQILRHLFGLEPKYDYPAALAFLVPVLLIGFSTWIVFRKIRLAEEMR